MMPNHEVDQLKRYLLKTTAWLTGWLAIQLAACVWWASAINTRVYHLEYTLEKIDSRVHTLETSVHKRP